MPKTVTNPAFPPVLSATDQRLQMLQSGGIPIEPLVLFLVKPEYCFKAGDLPAEVGDSVVKIVSTNGNYTANTTGTYELIQEEIQQGKPNNYFLRRTAGDGFDATIGSEIYDKTEGLILTCFSNKDVLSGTSKVVGSFSSSNTVNDHFDIANRQTGGSADRNLGTHVVWKNGTSAKVSTLNSDQCGGRRNVLANFGLRSDGDNYFYYVNGASIPISPVTNDGAWLENGATNPYTHMNIFGHKLSTGSKLKCIGDFAYFGIWDSVTDAQALLLNRYFSNLYPCRTFWMFSDSRFNSNDWMNEIEDENHVVAEYADLFHEIAVGGNTIAGIQTTWGNMVAANEIPDCPIIHIGINNIIADQTGGNAVTEWNALLDSIVAESQVSRVICFNETPFGENVAWTAARNAEHLILKAGIEAKVAATAKAFLMDSYAAVDDPGNPGSLRAGDTSDGLHLNATGQSRLAAELALSEAW